MESEESLKKKKKGKGSEEDRGISKEHRSQSEVPMAMAGII